MYAIAIVTCLILCYIVHRLFKLENWQNLIFNRLTEHGDTKVETTQCFDFISSHFIREDDIHSVEVFLKSVKEISSMKKEVDKLAEDLEGTLDVALGVHLTLQSLRHMVDRINFGNAERLQLHLASFEAQIPKMREFEEVRRKLKAFSSVLSRLIDEERFQQVKSSILPQNGSDVL